jgi:hypothetical protein
VNRAAVLRAVTGDNSYPRPGSIVSTWGRGGGIRVFVWMVAEVGGELHMNLHAGGKAMVPSKLAALDGRFPLFKKLRPKLVEDGAQELKAVLKGSVDDHVLQVWCTVLTHCVSCRYGRTVLTNCVSGIYGRTVLTNCVSRRYGHTVLTHFVSCMHYTQTLY